MRLNNMKNKNRHTTTEEFDRLKEKAKSGDNDALGVLCSHTYAMVYRFIFTKVNDQEDAEDLTSEVCVRVVKQLSRVKGSFIGWVLKTASNSVTDFYRRRDVRNRYQNEARNANVVADEPSQEKTLMHREIMQLLPQLTDEQRQVITLKFLEGFTTGEVAAALDKPAGAIRALQFRALSSLKSMLNEEGR